MSVYKASSPDNLKDATKVRDYILNINKAVQNLFNSLDPDDNFTEEELNKYHEIDTNISLLEMNIKGFRSMLEDTEKRIGSVISQQKNSISMKVRKGNVVSQLNLEPDALKISGERLEIRMQNLIVTDSQMYARGNITALSGKIANWTIEERNGHGYWRGGSSSRIDVNEITAQSGDAGTINATGDVTIRATFMGNFEEIDCTGAVFDGGISCSAMQEMGGSNNRLTCNTIRCYTSYRDPYEELPTRPSYPEEEDWPYDYSWSTYHKKYNTEGLPYGGLVVDYATCSNMYSKLAGTTWSDQRLKEDIKDITEEESEELLKVLRPVTYHFRGGTKMTGERMTGYIAQEVPEEFREETPKGYLGLRYGSISACLDSTLIKCSLMLEGGLCGRDKAN